MSPMEQALRDEIAWHEAEIEWLGGDLVLFSLGSVLDEHRARLAALTAALPAPGDAGEMQTITEEEVEAMRAAGTPIYMVEHYPPPVSLGEISQAQAQAMREALRRIAGQAGPYSYPWPETGKGYGSWAVMEARAALSASPLPAPATPGGPDA